MPNPPRPDPHITAHPASASESGAPGPGLSGGITVAHLLAGAPHGGAEAFFARLLPALQTDPPAAPSRHSRRVHHVAILRPHPGREAALRAAGIPIRCARFGGPLDFVSRWQIAAALRAWRPAVALAWMSRAARFLGTGSGVVTCARLGGYYNLKYYRGCRHLVVNTRDLQRWIVEQGWPAARAWYLPNFVDATPAIPVARHVFATPEGVPLIAALGRLHPHKGFDTALRALAACPSAWLWIAGAGGEDRNLRRLAEDLGVAHRVRFLGWVENPAAVLAAADIFLCPSRHEPLGNVILEAWAHGVAVVAAAAQGPRELIVPERTGVLVPIDDAAAMAAALRRVLAAPDLRAELVGRAQAVYSQGYARAEVVAAYRDFFATIAP